jgi:hypothetical protein
MDAAARDDLKRRLDGAVAALRRVLESWQPIASRPVVNIDAVEHVIAPVVGATIAAVVDCASDTAFGLSRFHCRSRGEPSSSNAWTVHVALPASAESVVRRLLLYGFYRLFPEGRFTELVMKRLAASEPTELDNGQFGGLLQSCAESEAAVSIGKWSVPFSDLWGVMSPTSYIGDRVVNLMLAHLRDALAALGDGVRSSVHIPHSHFIASARDGDCGPGSRRMFGLPGVQASRYDALETASVESRGAAFAALEALDTRRHCV